MEYPRGKGDYTENDIKSVINSVKNWPNCIKGILVGNENLFNNNNFGSPNEDMQDRVLKDIQRLRIGN